MTLLAPAFLLGLLAVGLPIWLHRLSSDNPNRRPFSSLMFLEPGEPRRVLAKKLQYLLLLALRIGVLVLLALAFAQPALWRAAQGGPGEGARLHVIVVDTSASMAYGDRWPRARGAALDVLGDLEGDDRAQLIAAGRVVEILTSATADRAVLRDALGTVEPGVFHIDYGRVMRALDGVLRGAELPVVLHLVTDAQQSSLPVRFAELAPRRAAEILIHDVATETRANWAIDSFGGSAVSGDLEASVRSFADQPAERTVELALNGRAVARQALTVAPGGRALAHFDALELAAGANRVTVSLSPADDLPADDRRFLALKKPQPRSVLLVAGASRGQGALFAGAAIDTLALLALTSETIAPSDLAGRSLGDYSFVVVTDAGVLGNAESALLESYVESGGALLLAFGQRSTSLANVPVTGEALRATTAVRSGGYAQVGVLDSGHPALRGVDELRSARFFRYIGIEPAAEDRVLAALDDGAPLLIERGLGAGRVLLFTSSVDREWNDLPVRPVFVPFISGLANHLLGGAGFTNEAELGTTLAVRAMGLQGGQIFDPRGDKALGLGGGDDVLLDELGFYEVVGGGRSELVAVNFDARESDLTPLNAATVTRWEGLGVRAAGSAAGAAAAGDDEPAPVPLGPWLLAALLAAAVVESWVGNWHLRVRRGIAA